MELPVRDTLILAIIVLFFGQYLTRKIHVLAKYNIPEPVSGGVVASLIIMLLHYLYGLDISFDLTMRDDLLVIFFTTIGLTAKLSELIKGGRLLVVLLLLASVFLVIQNLVGVSLSTIMGYNPLGGLLGGSVSLSGGHGTAIAWAPIFATNHGMDGAMEVGIAVATFGLVAGGLVGGPLAQALIKRHGIQSSHDAHLTVGVDRDREPYIKILYDNILRSILMVAVAGGIGEVLNRMLVALGFSMPSFVTALFGGILLANTIPVFVKRFPWPGDSPSMSLIADISLGLFLAMSLMSMQLWVVSGVLGTIMILMGLQILAVGLFAYFVIFPMTGKDYTAVVISSGYIGMALGATPTAVANMSAITKEFGAAPIAFIIIPLIGAFFIDIMNAIIIQGFIAVLG
jgi:ESS family glutamate:Na+ symporter